MDPATHNFIFCSVQYIGRANYIFFDSLVQARNADPDFDQAITQLLKVALAAISPSYVSYCTGLGTKLATLPQPEPFVPR